MLTSEIVDIINKIEEEYPVDQWICQGIHIWPWIRIKLNFDLVNVELTGLQAKSRQMAVSYALKYAAKLLASSARRLRAGLSDRQNDCAFRRPVDTVLLSDGISFSWIQGKWYEKYCDPFISYFQQKGISSVLLTPQYEYYIPRYSSSKFIQPYLDMIRIQNSLLPKRRSYKPDRLPRYEEFLGLLKAERVPAPLPEPRVLNKDAALIRSYSDFFLRVLLRLKPSMSFVVSYYNREGMGFNLACRKLNIPVVDIQHGSQGELHAAYGRWKKVPREGYELLPTYFWCWSSYEAKTINQWNAASYPWHRPLIGENLWLALWQGKNDLVDSHDRIISQIKSSDPASIHILVTLQFGLRTAHFRPVLEAMNESPAAWRWWIRLHPSMRPDRRSVNNHLSQNVRAHYYLDLPSDLPLFALLRHTDVLITHSSSTVLDAEAFGVPSVITDPYGRELYIDQISRKAAFAAYTGRDIVNTIRALMKDGRFKLEIRPVAPWDKNDELNKLVRSIIAKRNGRDA